MLALTPRDLVVDLATCSQALAAARDLFLAHPSKGYQKRRRVMSGLQPIGSFEKLLTDGGFDLAGLYCGWDAGRCQSAEERFCSSERKFSSCSENFCSGIKKFCSRRKRFCSRRK